MDESIAGGCREFIVEGLCRTNSLAVSASGILLLATGLVARYFPICQSTTSRCHVVGVTRTSGLTP